MKKNFEELSLDVLQWAKDRNLVHPENVPQQALKMVSEVGELCDAIIKKDGEETIDAIGDTLVTILILASQLNLNCVDCLASAFEVIAKRKGKTVGGTFIKE